MATAVSHVRDEVGVGESGQSGQSGQSDEKEARRRGLSVKKQLEVRGWGRCLAQAFVF